MRLPDVAHQLAIWDAGDEGELFERRLAVYDCLYFDHIPTLSDGGVVQYHQRADEVSLGPAADQLKKPVEDWLAEELSELLAAEGSIIETTGGPD